MCVKFVGLAGFLSEAALLDHETDHKKAPAAKIKSCHICNRKISRNNFKVHLKSHDEKKEKLPCSQCDKTFCTTSGLSRHVKGFHQGIRPHKCFVCGEASFVQSYQLTVHLASKHGIKKDARYKCDLCDSVFKVFKRKYSKDPKAHFRVSHPRSECQSSLSNPIHHHWKRSKISDLCV